MDEAAAQAYYHDPEIVWLEAGQFLGGIVGGPERRLHESGFYVMPLCGRMECCAPEGPFATAEQALQWSRQNVDR
jgi:hypothetical protein